MTTEQKQALLKEVEKLHARLELSKTVGPDYYNPGMMEFLDQAEGIYNPETGEILIRFESRGTRYDGRSEKIERVNVGDVIHIVREKTNPFNSNNFILFVGKDKNVGNMPAELCNVIAPLYDTEELTIESAQVSYVEHLSKRSRYAKQAILFVEAKLYLV